jgi:hypothetical protein
LVEAAMAGRPEMLRSAAYAALKPSGRRVLGVVENVLSRTGNGTAISLGQFTALGLCRTAARYGIRQCERVGLIKVEVGPRQVHVFSFRDGWKTVDADEAARRMALAHQRPSRRARINTVREPVEPPQPVEVKPVARPRHAPRGVPSLPRLSFLERP